MNKEIIIDCSVSAAWVLPDEISKKAVKLLEGIMVGEYSLTVPSLWLYEMTNLLKSAILRNRLSEQQAKKGLYLIQEIPIKIIEPQDHNEFIMLEAAIRHNLSVYDAAYFSLAEKCGLELFTTDKDLLKLSRKFSWIKKIS